MIFCKEKWVFYFVYCKLVFEQLFKNFISLYSQKNYLFNDQNLNSFLQLMGRLELNIAYFLKKTHFIVLLVAKTFIAKELNSFKKHFVYFKKRGNFQ